jgi:hypothetical protein
MRARGCSGRVFVASRVTAESEEAREPREAGVRSEIRGVFGSCASPDTIMHLRAKTRDAASIVRVWSQSLIASDVPNELDAARWHLHDGPARPIRLPFLSRYTVDLRISFHGPFPLVSYGREAENAEAM